MCIFHLLYYLLSQIYQKSKRYLENFLLFVFRLFSGRLLDMLCCLESVTSLLFVYFSFSFIYFWFLQHILSSSFFLTIFFIYVFPHSRAYIDILTLFFRFPLLYNILPFPFAPLIVSLMTISISLLEFAVVIGYKYK